MMIGTTRATVIHRNALFAFKEGFPSYQLSQDATR